MTCYLDQQVIALLEIVSGVVAAPSQIPTDMKVLRIKSPSNLSLTYICSPFWDIVVLTSIDDDQRSCYEQQIQLKKERKEIPTSVRQVCVNVRVQLLLYQWKGYHVMLFMLYD